MYFTAVQSDQLYTWSDENAEANPPPHCGSAATLSCANCPRSKSILRGSLIERYKRCGKPGCKCADGPGHGPKYYLSVSYPGLRPQMDYVPQESIRANGGVPGQLPPSPRDPGGDLRDQPRTAAPPRGALKAYHAPNAFCPPHTDRCGIGRRTPRQYARSLARRQSKVLPTGEATDESQDHRNITGANRPTFTYASRRRAKSATIRRARSASMHCERRRWNWAGANP